MVQHDQHGLRIAARGTFRRPHVEIVGLQCLRPTTGNTGLRAELDRDQPGECRKVHRLVELQCHRVEVGRAVAVICRGAGGGGGRVVRGVWREGVGAFERGCGQGGQGEGVGQRVIGEEILLLQEGGDHDDAVEDDRLVFLQGAGDFDGADAAVAFADDEFGAAGALRVVEPEGDGFGERFGVRVDVPERGGCFCGVGGEAVAGADGVDEHHVGEGEPGVCVGFAVGAGAVGHCGGVEGEDFGAGRAHLHVGAARTRAAVEEEGDGAVGRGGVEGVRRVEDGGGWVALGVAQFQRAGGGGVGERRAAQGDFVLGGGVRRMQCKAVGRLGSGGG